MKSIIPDTPQAQGSEVRQEQVAKQQKEYKLIGHQRKIAGLTLYELDRKTNVIRPAAVTRTAIVKTDGSAVYKTRTDVRQGCFYIQALNAKNAERKLRKLGLIDRGKIVVKITETMKGDNKL